MTDWQMNRSPLGFQLKTQPRKNCGMCTAPYGYCNFWKCRSDVLVLSVRTAPLSDETYTTWWHVRLLLCSRPWPSWPPWKSHPGVLLCGLKKDLEKCNMAVYWELGGLFDKSLHALKRHFFYLKKKKKNVNVCNSIHTNDVNKGHIGNIYFTVFWIHIIMMSIQ